MASHWNKSPLHDRLKRLAESIDALVERDEAQARRAIEIGEHRRRAACELFAICQRFVRDVNEMLERTQLELDPPDFPPDSFREYDANLIQIHVRGRVLQIEFQAPDTLISTEDFRVPYILEGAIRSFNQDLLDRNAVDERLLFFCFDRADTGWRYFDARTYQSGMLTEQYLITVMESIL